MHPRGAPLGDRDQVAVRPDARVLREVCGVEPLPLRVVVEAQWARWKRSRANEVADARLVRPDRADVQAEAPALRLAGIDGKVRVAEHEAADDLGAAGDRLERNRPDVGGEPLVLIIVEDRARGHDRAQRSEVEPAPRRVARALAHAQVRGSRAEHAYPLLRRDAPQRLGFDHRTVVEQDLGAAGERRELPVPHHPGGRGVEEELFARPQVAVQNVLLHVLEQSPARAVDDALRPARRPRGEQHEQRMIERIALPLPLVGGRSSGPVDGHRQIRWERAVVHDDDRAERRQPGRELAQPARLELGLPDRADNQDLWIELGEAAEHVVHAHLGCGTRKARTGGRNAQRRHHRPGVVSDQADHVVAGSDAERSKGGGKPADEPPEFATGEPLARPIGADRGDRNPVEIAAGRTREQVLRVAQAQAREESGMFHVPARKHRKAVALDEQPRPFEEERPEPLRLIHREPVELAAGADGAARHPLAMRDERRQLGRRDGAGRRCPDRRRRGGMGVADVGRARRHCPSAVAGSRQWSMLSLRP